MSWTAPQFATPLLPLFLCLCCCLFQNGVVVKAQCPFEAIANLFNMQPRSGSATNDAFAYANSGEYQPSDWEPVYRPQRSEKFLPPACGLRVQPCYEASSYRTYDGSCNNINEPMAGMPNSTYIRLMSSKYADGYRAPRRATDGSPLANARVIRQRLMPMSARNHPRFDLLTMLWGQFVAHDMSLLKRPEFDVPCCTTDSQYVRRRQRFCYPIKVPPSDPTMGSAGIRCLNFTRTVTDKDMGCATGSTPAQQINAVTAYLDLSNVYGLSVDMAHGLRSFEDGKLRTVFRNNRVVPPMEDNVTRTCFCSQPGEDVCYKTGDSRSNQNPQLAILQILFVREHNRIASQLAQINWHWGDERLYHEARRILVAAYQQITYYEWLPLLLGRANLMSQSIIYNTPGFVNDYDGSIDAQVSQEHAHAAFRFFHTHIIGRTNFVSHARTTTKTFQLSNQYHRPAIVEQGTNFEQLTVGMVTQPSDGSDNIHVEDITDKMFACGKNFGLDLRASDIQRDRDHGLSYYNDYRSMCGLKSATSWNDYLDVIPSEQLSILRTLYKSHRDVDLSVGGSLEALVQGAECGTTFRCIMNDQFSRTRKGDRHWFENESSGLTAEQLLEIRKASVARIFCDNGDGFTQMQRNGFLILSGNNPLQSCSSIPSIDLTKWRETYFWY